MPGDSDGGHRVFAILAAAVVSESFGCFVVAVVAAVAVGGWID